MKNTGASRRRHWQGRLTGENHNWVPVKVQGQPNALAGLCTIVLTNGHKIDIHDAALLFINASDISMLLTHPHLTT